MSLSFFILEFVSQNLINLLLPHKIKKVRGTHMTISPIQKYLNHINLTSVFLSGEGLISRRRDFLTLLLKLLDFFETTDIKGGSLNLVIC
jgi:hypothetical protein